MTSVVKITNLDETNNILKFTLTDINISIANAIRRIILSEIPCLVFNSQPNNKNNILIKINKTRLNNELIKQRVSCIPVHIDDIENFPYEDYIIELDKKNDTDNIIYATTEDFKIKNIKFNKYLESSEVKKIFPPDNITGDYIDIVRLRPKLSENLEPEHIKMECKLSIGTANEDGMFNVVSTCSYGNTLDPVKIQDKWKEKEEELKKTYSKEETEFQKKDWMLIDAKRIFIEYSYDFIIESIGIYNNFKIVELAVNIIIKKLYTTIESIKNNTDFIKDGIDTLNNCFIITIENEDYTIGKILEYCLFRKYFKDKKEITYVAFLKKHPHDKDSFIKISFKNIVSKDDIIILFEECVNDSILLLNSIKEYFSDK